MPATPVANPRRIPLYISLPTDGLYAQTIMDECLALEEHQGSVDWVLNDPDPELGTIGTLVDDEPSCGCEQHADAHANAKDHHQPAERARCTGTHWTKWCVGCGGQRQ